MMANKMLATFADIFGKASSNNGSEYTCIMARPWPIAIIYRTRVITSALRVDWDFPIKISRMINMVINITIF